ncbi:MAG: sulfurtransferase TusA family protein [Desulfobulbaceae bacterium]|nr:sulfurtransferase TusA family protein [Desulfobulbaceae bacterium]
MTVDRDLDVLGKACPIPLITVAKEVRALRKGQLLRIIGNDPLFEVTILDFCREGGHEVLETCRDGKKVSITFVV